ncbi:MAG: TolC family protein [Flavobacteriales bacterium]|nr:TolC family protein [Flavobacteriales bacterium]
MSKKILLAVAILLSSINVFSQNELMSLRFEDALMEMNSNNLAIKGAEAEKRSNEFLRKTTRGLFLPKISFSANYMKFDQDIGVDLGGITDALGGVGISAGGSLSPSKLVLQKEQVATAGINMIWPIFTGGKIMAANRAMDAKIDEAQHKIDETRNELNTELVERYYGYRLSNRAVDLYQDVLDAMLLHQQNAKKLEENGMIAKAQKLYADLSVSTAKSDLQSAKNTRNTVEEALKNTIVTSNDINTVSELFLLKRIESVDYFIESAMTNNPLLKEVESKKELAKQNYNIQRAGYMPTVAIVGNKLIADHQLAEIMPNWFVGVNLHWTLFDGMSRVYKAKAALATVDRVEFLESKAHEDITTLINKLYNDLSSNVDELETLDVTYTFALEYNRVSQRAFAEGISTSKDVVDSELILNKVKVGRLKVMNDYVVSLAKLLQYSGKSDLFVEYSKRPDRERENFELKDTE